VVNLFGVDFLPQSVLATRFAPSPNGQLHLGHAFSALCVHDFARSFGGKFLLRIEDIDGQRSRPQHVKGISRDLCWLGLNWDGPVIFQSQRIKNYQRALSQLDDMGLVYRCWCTRSEIAKALKDKPVLHGPDGPVYPGTCRGRGAGPGDYCWRLDMQAAVERVGPLCWHDLAVGKQLADPMLFGDIVVWRKDAPASYHLAATLDDAHDGISHVVRGQDLFAYTAIHRVLQVLLQLAEPVYWHHPLLLDEKGEKLAKSHMSKPLSDLRHAEVDGIKLLDDLRDNRLPLGISRTRA
jgi:glutamyl-Q tRNA(Asp) synthetase